MKGTDVFPGKYLRAADLGTAEPVVTIKTVKMEDLGDETKAVVYFEGKDRGVVLNKTNWNMLVELTGEDDSDHWAGHRIRLFVAKVDFQGKRVPSIRIKEANGGVAAKKVRPPAVIEPPHDGGDEPPGGDDDDDRVPF